MAALKPLHLAQNLQELNKKIGNEKMKQGTPKVLCRIADKILLKAMDELLNGDEEQAYVLYMRFLDVYKSICASKEYRRDKTEVNKLLPHSKVTKALEKAEELSKTLKRRYSELSSCDKEDADMSDVTVRVGADQMVPTSLSKLHPLPNQPLVPLIFTPQGDDPDNSATVTASITSQELYLLLTQQPKEVLVLDCRPRAEFIASHPDTKKKFPQWLCLPEETVRKGVTDKSATAFLSVAGKERWKARGTVKTVVLVDDHSTSEMLSQQDTGQRPLPILALKDALYKFCVDSPLSSEPVVLEGGYAMWYLTYAVTCVGAYKRRPSPSSVEGDDQTVPGKKEKEEKETRQSYGMNYPSFPEISNVPNTDDSSGGVVDVDVTPNTEIMEVDPSQLPQTTPLHVVDQDSTTNHVSSLEQIVPPFVGVVTPLPPLPPTVPAVLSLEGESDLIAPTLNSENDLVLTQLLMPEVIYETGSNGNSLPVRQYNGVPTSAMTFTQPNSYLLSEGGVMRHGHLNNENPQEFIQSSPQNIQQSFQQQRLPNVEYQQFHQTLQNVENPLPEHQNNFHPSPAHQYFQQPLQNAQNFQHNPQSAGVQHFQQPTQGVEGQNLHQIPGRVVNQEDIQTPVQTLGWQHFQQSPHNSGGQSFQHPHGDQSMHTPHNSESQYFQQLPQNLTNQHFQQRQDIPPQNSGGYGIDSSPQSVGGGRDSQHPHPQQQQSVQQYLSPQNFGVQQTTNSSTQQYPQQQPVQQTQTQPTSNMAPPTTFPPPVSIQMDEQTQQDMHGHVMNILPQAEDASVPRGGGQQSSDENKRKGEEKLKEETQKLEELRSQMQSELSRLTEMRLQQEMTSRQLAEGQAELRAQRLSHQLEMEEKKKDLERMKKQYEQEVESMVAEKQRYLQLQELEHKNLGEGHKRRELSLNTGMPTNWEKRIDQKTGRYYYVDHSTRTTHWNPPTHLIKYQLAAQRQQDYDAGRRQAQDETVVRRQIQDEELRRKSEEGRQNFQQTVPSSAPNHVMPRLSVPSQVTSGHVPSVSSGQVPTSHYPAQPTFQTPPSSNKMTTPTTQVQPSLNKMTTPTTRPQPNLNKMTTPTNSPQYNQVQSPPTKPVIDRSVKPTPTVDRSKKPIERKVLWTSSEIQLKEGNLQAVFGAESQLLTGLRNLGNTCFMNSTLQCLSHTSPVMPYFTSLTFQRDINYSNPIGHKGAVAKEFAWLMRVLWSGRYKSVTPRDFKNMVDCYIPNMQGHAQQDAQEFLAFLMNELHEDLNRVHNRAYIPEPDSSRMEDRQLANLAWSNHLKRNNSVIVEFFQGMYRSTVVCNYCRKRSTTFEPFMYLSLPIPAGPRSYSLQDCLQLFSEEETVPWNCSSCKQSVGARKKLELWRLPSILLIALNRFTNDGLWKEKRQNYIDYPVGNSFLNLSSFIVGDRPKAANYRLYAVSNHFGTQSGGHYTACCWNPFNKTYYNFDDHEVREASAKQVKSGAGYLLFYTSLDHRPPRTKF